MATRAGALVVRHGWRTVDVVDHDVHAAIVIEIADRRSSRYAGRCQSVARSRPDIFEAASAEIPEEERALRVRRAPRCRVRLRIDMAVHDENVQPAIVVVV